MSPPLPNLLGLEGSAAADLALVQRGHVAPAPIVADFAGGAALATRNVSLSRPPEQEEALAREKADAVALWIQLRAAGSSRAAAADLLYAAHAHRFPLMSVHGHGGRSLLAPPKGVYNLDHWAKDAGAAPAAKRGAALVRSYARGRRERTGDPRFWDAFGSLFLSRNGPSFAESYEAALRVARSRGFHDAAPSIHQVRYWYDHCVDPAAVIVAREGEDALAARVEYFIRRDWTAVLPGDIWFSDHHTLDCPARVPDGKGGWRPIRPTLTAVMDARSLYFVGWQIAEDAGCNDSIATSVALGIIVAGFRPPAYLYVDRGADYRMIGWDRPVTCAGHEHSVLSQLGIQSINSLPYRAQAKTIERMFGTVCEQFSRFWAGYRGNSPDHRTEKADYYWDNPEHLPTVEELSRAFAEYLATVYHCRPGEGCILQGRCPADVWNARPLVRSPLSHTDLYRAFLLPVGLRSVGRGPSIAWENRYYYSHDLWSWVGVKGERGKILVKVDRFNPEHIFAYHPDGRPICEACTRERVAALALTEGERNKIAQAERLKVQQRRAAYAVVETETGGTWKLGDPRDRILRLAAGDAAGEIRKIGTRGSVKGGSHRYDHHILAPPAAPDAPAAVAMPRLQGPTMPIQLRPERSEVQSADLARFQAAILARAAAPDAEDPAPPAAAFGAALARAFTTREEEE